MGAMPVSSAIEVQQANPGLCAILENAALLYASGQAGPARILLEQGVQTDADAKSSPLAWLALFDVLQRAGDRAAFDNHALQYVVQFERSAPTWDADKGKPQAGAKPVAGGDLAPSGKLSAASAASIDMIKRAADRNLEHARLDLASVTGFDDAGARMLADALAYVRKKQFALQVQRADKLRAAVEAMVKRGKDAGEGVWLLSLELMQALHDQAGFDDRAIEYAMAFELSPPSWEPGPQAEAPPAEAAAPAPTSRPTTVRRRARRDAGVDRRARRRVGAATVAAQRVRAGPPDRAHRFLRRRSRRLRLRRRVAEPDQPHRGAAPRRADRGRDAHRACAAAADRHLAAPFRQESRLTTDAARPARGAWTAAMHRMESFHGTTILSVRRDGRVALGGDGQVTLGNIVVKATAKKIRRLYHDRVLAGFAGATADAFTLFERFEAKLEKHQGHLVRSAVELAKDWRADRVLRRLEAMLAIADRTASLIVTGNGDVLEPELGIVAIGSGGAYAQAAARALLAHSTLDATAIVRESLGVAADICIYTNRELTIETLEPQ